MNERFLGDDELRNSLVEAARNSKTEINIMARFQSGDPFFDTLPIVLAVSPLDVDVKAILIMPDSWKDDSEVIEKLDELAQLFENRGNAELRVITEGDYSAAMGGA